MKKRIYIIIVVIAIIITVFMFKNSEVQTIREIVPTNNPNRNIIVNEEKKNNKSIIGTIIIPDILNENIVQTTNNDYYLNHDINRNESIYGATFMDYRISLDSKKYIIYGHNDKLGDLPFSILENYMDKNYYDSHKYIEFKINDTVKNYIIFSVYVETSDWYYTKLNFNGNEEWLNHLNKLKNNSLYNTNIEISSNDNIIILQTCSYNNKYSNFKDKYILVSAKEI